jgi:signal transduction histidine kinase
MASFLIRAVREKRNAARAHSARAALSLKKGFSLKELSLTGLIRNLIQPVSIGEDVRRREHVLNIILVLSILCFLVLGITLIWNWDTLGDSYGGINPLVFGVLILFYVALLVMSKKGYGRAASFLLVLFDAIGTIYVGWQWGASLPATLLLTALVIVTASVLLGSTTGFIVTGGMIGVLTVLGIHEAAVLNVPDWRYDEITATDVISYSALFLFMSFIGWLSNREIDASLTRARTSEKMLEAERNALEKKVAERTAELIAIQANTVAGLERSASMGELSQGVFHDLMSPLSAVALSVEEIANMPENGSGHDTRQAQEMVEKAVTASKRMRSYMESVRRHIDDGKSRATGMGMEAVDVGKEISMARDILAYKARMANVDIVVGLERYDSAMAKRSGPITIAAQPVRVHQMLLNLMSNAIDACSVDACANKEESGTVNVSVEKYPALKDHGEKGGEFIRITFADNGCGIPAEKLKTLFDKPFTTKLKGTGIGLMTVKSIVEKELGGSISVKSTEGVGTTFIITIPLIKHGESSDNKTGLGKYRDGGTPHP